MKGKEGSLHKPQAEKLTGWFVNRQFVLLSNPLNSDVREVASVLDAEGYSFSHRESFGCVGVWLSQSPAALEREIHIRSDGARTLIARDLIGMQLLYYRALSGGMWCCSSDMRVLRRLLPQRNALNRSCIASMVYNRMGFDFSLDTQWEGIKRVPAGGVLCLGSGGAQVRELTQRNDFRELLCEHSYTPSRLLSHLREVLEPRQDSPVLLSGGTDSSLLSSILAQRKTSLNSGTLVFPSYPSCDESQAVQEIVRELSLKNYAYSPEGVGPFSPAALHVHDKFLESGPCLNPCEFHEVDLINKLADYFGRDEVITGVGADQLFYSPLYWSGRQRLLLAQVPPREHVRWMRRLGRTLWGKQILQSKVFGRPITKRSSAVVQELLPPWCDANYCESVLWSGIKRLAHASFVPGRTWTLERLSSWAWDIGVQTLARQQKAAGVKVYHPFFDEYLWASFLLCPGWLNVGVGQKAADKVILRRSHELLGALPPRVAWRGKLATFDAFIFASLFGAGWSVVDDLSCSMRLGDMGIVDEERFRKFVLDVKTGTTTPQQPISSIWNTLAVEMWVRKVEASLLFK